MLVSTQPAPGDDFEDAENWTMLHSGLVLVEGPENNTDARYTYTGAEPVAIGVDARYLAIRVLSTHQKSQSPEGIVTLAEVRFWGALPPPPLPPPPQGTVMMIR